MSQDIYKYMQTYALRDLFKIRSADTRRENEKLHPWKCSSGSLGDDRASSGMKTAAPTRGANAVECPRFDSHDVQQVRAARMHRTASSRQYLNRGVSTMTRGWRLAMWRCRVTAGIVSHSGTVLACDRHVNGFIASVKIERIKFLLRHRRWTTRVIEKCS